MQKLVNGASTTTLCKSDEKTTLQQLAKIVLKGTRYSSTQEKKTLNHGTQGEREHSAIMLSTAVQCQGRYQIRHVQLRARVVLE